MPHLTDSALFSLVAACLGLVSKSKNSDRNEEYIAAHKVVEVMEQMCAQLNTTDLPESSTMTNGVSESQGTIVQALI